MTIKPFLNKMSADLASALNGGKGVSNSSSLDSKAGDTTGDVSFKNALTQALEPKNSSKTQKSENPKTALTFVSAPASSLKTKTVETGKASNKVQNSNDESVQRDESVDSLTEPSADLLTAAMAAQAAPVQAETPELRLNLLSLAQAQALAEGPIPGSDTQSAIKPAALYGNDLTSASIPHHSSAMPQGAAASDVIDAERALKQESAAVDSEKSEADTQAQIVPLETTSSDVNPSLIALMAATPSFSAMPAVGPSVGEKSTPQKTSVSQVYSGDAQKPFQPELAQSSFLPLQPLNTQTFEASLQGTSFSEAMPLNGLQAESAHESALALDNSSSDAYPALPADPELSSTPTDAFNGAANNDFSSLSLSFMPTSEANTLPQAQSDLSQLAQSVLQSQSADFPRPQVDATIANTIQLQGQFLNSSAFGSEKPKVSESVDTKKVDTVSTKQMTELPSASFQQVTTSKNKSSNMETLGRKTKPVEESETQETAANTVQKNGFEHLLSQARLSVENIAVSGTDSASSTDSTLPAFVSQEAAPGDQVMEATAYAAKNGHRELIIKLNPDNLGAVKINLISHAEGGLSAKLIASSADSAALLSQQAESLQASLEAKGVKVDKISVIVAGQGEFSAVASGNEANKSQSQQSGHDHNPNPQPEQQSHTSQQQNFNQEQQNQQMAQAFQQQMNQSHRQSYFTQSQSNNAGTATTTQVGGVEVDSSTEATPPVKNQTPGAISVLA